MSGKYLKHHPNGSARDAEELYALDAAVAELDTSDTDTATVTINLAVDTNALTLNGTVYTYGSGGIGPAVVAGSTAVKNAANAVLMAKALAANPYVASATANGAVVTVTSTKGSVLVFTSVTATRLVAASTSPAYGKFAQIRAALAS